VTPPFAVSLSQYLYGRGLGGGGHEDKDLSKGDHICGFFDEQQAEALDKAYRAGLDRVPDSTKKQDPWENMRTDSASSSTKLK
jgi:hypothetical protein